MRCAGDVASRGGAPAAGGVAMRGGVICCSHGVNSRIYRVSNVYLSYIYRICTVVDSGSLTI